MRDGKLVKSKAEDACRSIRLTGRSGHVIGGRVHIEADGRGYEVRPVQHVTSSKWASVHLTLALVPYIATWQIR